MSTPFLNRRKLFTEAIYDFAVRGWFLIYKSFVTLLLNTDNRLSPLNFFEKFDDGINVVFTCQNVLKVSNIPDDGVFNELQFISALVFGIRYRN